MTRFITPEELKAYPLPVTTKQWALVGDDQLEVVIGHASEHLEDYMDRKILPASYTDRRRGTDSNKILLSVYPVTALDSAYSYDTFGNERSWAVNEFYINGPAGILEFNRRDKYNFPKMNIWTFTYTAGYEAVPGPIKHATALQTVKFLQPLFRGGTNFTETELIASLDDQIIELLDFYKRRRIA